MSCLQCHFSESFVFQNEKYCGILQIIFQFLGPTQALIVISVISCPICRLRDEKRDKWWEDELGKVTAKLKVNKLLNKPDLLFYCLFLLKCTVMFHKKVKKHTARMNQR